MSGERKRGALTPELGCGFAVGVLLAWAVLLQYGLYEQRAAERREGADDRADNHADEQVVHALQASEEGRFVEGAASLESEARGHGENCDAVLSVYGLADGEAASDEFGGRGGVVAGELDGARPLVYEPEDMPVFSVHGDILQENGPQLVLELKRRRNGHED